jgi:hypothetical protein
MCGKRGERRAQRGQEVAVERRAQRLLGVLERGPDDAAAGVVDEHVDAAVLRKRRVHELVGGGGIAEVALDRQGAVPLERLEVAERELRALRFESLRDGAADRPAGPGDDRHPVLEASHQTKCAGGCGPHTFHVVSSAGS